MVVDLDRDRTIPEAIMFDCITKVTRNRDVARLRRWIDGPAERAVPETAALEDSVKAPEAVAVRTRARVLDSEIRTKTKSFEG